MPEILSNLQWMSFNILLACLGLIFGLLFLKQKKYLLKVILFVLWILFLPNTIYLLTDLQHLPRQVFEQSNFFYRLIIFFQYIVLFLFGIFTYIYGLSPIDKLFKLKNWHNHKLKFFLIGTFNFVIAFGVGMGRIERTHSWYIFTQPARVISDMYALLSSADSVIFVLIFGVICNLLFFAFHLTVKKTLKI